MVPVPVPEVVTSRVASPVPDRSAWSLLPPPAARKLAERVPDAVGEKRTSAVHEAPPLSMAPQVSEAISKCPGSVPTSERTRLLTTA
jgi:hypothetical protein